MLPRAGSASSSPTMRNVCARPSSRCTVTLAPKCTLLLSAAGSTTFALDRRAFQYRSSRWVAAIAVRSFLATAAWFAASKRLSVRSIAARPSAVTKLGCGDTGRSGRSSISCSISLTNARLITLRSLLCALRAGNIGRVCLFPRDREALLWRQLHAQAAHRRQLYSRSSNVYPNHPAQQVQFNSFHPTDLQAEIAGQVKENSRSRRLNAIPFAIVRIVFANCSGRQHRIELWNCIQSCLHKRVGVWTRPRMIIAVCSKLIGLDHEAYLRNQPLSLVAVYAQNRFG